MVSREEDAGLGQVAALEDQSEHDIVALQDAYGYLPPGSEVLVNAQIQERPYRDFLMHQQGFLSGKTEGDLDSVPGYYGGTASYKFVQNAKHLNKLRVTRYTLHRDLGHHYDEYGRVQPESVAGLREESLAAAKAVPYVPYSSVGPDMAFKEADQYGAFLPTMRPFASRPLPYDRMRTSPYGAFSPYGSPYGVSSYGPRVMPSSRMPFRSGYEYGGLGMDAMYRPPSSLASRLNPQRSEGADLFNRVNRPFRSADAFGPGRPSVDNL
jgi:hypothetical protein